MGFGPGGQNLGTVISRPDEIVGRQGGKIFVRAAEQIGMITGFSQDLDQPASMPERIEIGGRFDLHSEFRSKKPFPLQDLTDERFAAGHIAVGLDEPTAQDGPAFFPDEPPDAAEQGRFVLLDPVVKERLVMGEHEIPPGLAESGGRAEGGQGFARPFRPFPEPDRIDMGVANEMDFPAGGDVDRFAGLINGLRNG